MLLNIIHDRAVNQSGGTGSAHRRLETDLECEYPGNNIYIFALGGVMLQIVVMGIIYLTLGIGSEGNYYLPLLFMIINLRTIIVNLYPRIFARYGVYYPSDGLLLKRILQMKVSPDNRL